MKRKVRFSGLIIMASCLVLSLISARQSAFADDFVIVPANMNILGYYVELNGQPTGPFYAAEIRLLIERGQLTRNTLVWQDGMSGWTAAGAVTELSHLFFSIIPPPPFTSAPSEPVPAGQISSEQIAGQTSYSSLPQSPEQDEAPESSGNKPVSFLIGTELYTGLDFYKSFNDYYNYKCTFGFFGYTGFLQLDFFSNVVLTAAYNSNFGKRFEAQYYSEYKYGPNLSLSFSLFGKIPFRPTENFEIYPYARLRYNMGLYRSYTYYYGIRISKREDLKDSDSLLARFGLVMAFNFTDSIRFFTNISYNTPLTDRDDYFYLHTLRTACGFDFKYKVSRHVRITGELYYYVSHTFPRKDEDRDTYMYHGPNATLGISFIF